MRYIGKVSERELSSVKDTSVVIGRHVRFSQSTLKFHIVRFWSEVA